MKLYRAILVRPREYRAKTYFTWVLLVAAESVEDARAKVIEDQGHSRIEGLFIREVEDDQAVFQLNGFSLTPAELEKYRKAYEKKGEAA